MVSKGSPKEAGGAPRIWVCMQVKNRVSHFSVDIRDAGGDKTASVA